MKTLLRTFCITAATTAIAMPAMARSTGRQGLNFGTSVKLMDGDNSTNANSSTDKNSHTKTSGQSFSPYMAYSFSEINLGAVCTVEQSGEEYNETSTTNNQQIYRKTNAATKSFSLFGRFNFGKVMFMEAGFGVYNQVVDVHTENRIVGNGGQFTGQNEDYTIQGMGPGYHVGGGLELPISNGFYFTSAYLVRSFQLRDQSKSDIGEKMANQQKRELTFGIAYYD